MSKVPQNDYTPDFVYPPGETLFETIEAKGMSQAELATRTDYSKKTINQIIRGKAPITPEVALRLELALGIPASFWNQLERDYQEWQTRQQADQRLKDWIDWVKAFPVKQMADWGWLPGGVSKEQQVFETLKFFGAASPDAWHELYGGMKVHFRQSTTHETQFGATVAWLRQGELKAQELMCSPFDQYRFKEALASVRRLTTQAPDVFQPELIRLCAEGGVAVTFVPELPKTGISGATRWLHADKALIELSLRYKSDDQLWFTFFHEAGHVLLHGKRDIFLDAVGEASTNDKETEADAFAREQLISSVVWHAYVAEGDTRSKAGIEAFATEIGVAPGIVVGRLQHEGRLPYTHCNDLKRRLVWASDSGE